jgi:hypothetical protein
MFARSQWVAPSDQGIQADAQEVLEASEQLLQEFRERQSTYRRWGNEACALLSRLNRDISVSKKLRNLQA